MDNMQHEIFVQMDEADMNACSKLRNTCISSIVCSITDGDFPLFKLAMLYEIIACWSENGGWVDGMLGKAIDDICPPMVVGHDEAV